MNKTYDSSFDRSAWRLAGDLRKPAAQRQQPVLPEPPPAAAPASIPASEAAPAAAPAIQDVSAEKSDSAPKPVPADIAEESVITLDAETDLDVILETTEEAADTAEPAIEPAANASAEAVPEADEEDALPPPAIRFDQDGIYRDQVWKSLLLWGSETLTANWGYVADSQGLIIASHGQAAGVDEERATANLFSAVSNLSNCGTGKEPPKALIFYINGYWHAVFCHAMGQERSSWLIIGFTSRLMPAYRVLNTVRMLFQERLADL